MLFLIGFMGVGGILIVGGLWLTTPRRSTALRTAAPPPPLIVAETKPAPGPAREKPTQTKAQAPAAKPKDETTITEVLAALQLKPEETSRAAAQGEERGGTPRAAKKSDPRREIALQRAKEALEGDKPLTPPAGSAASPPVGRPPSQESSAAQTIAKAGGTQTGSSAPPTLEVHASGKEGARWFAEGLRHQREGRYAPAIEEYEKAVTADPGNLEAYNNLGVLLKETGRVDLAVEAFQRALALDPKYEKALNNLGVVRYLKGQYEEAISLFRQAILINPDNLESYTNLGIIYFLADRLEEARGAFERALQLDPKHAETHYNLALLYERRGIWPKAFTHYQRFIELASPKHATLVAKVRERLLLLSQRR
ncbi:MAG: tetratricopeptide repeat protein [Candidatus Rokubacteria bacterium]|nr:tetratricopeptide repeat protein [Candidatus Rokubacteria bacterium]